jgi:hypothetical protein
VPSCVGQACRHRNGWNGWNLDGLNLVLRTHWNHVFRACVLLQMCWRVFRTRMQY